MVRSKKSNAMTRSRTNPLNVVRRPPRPISNFDGSILNGSTVQGVITTTTNAGTGLYAVDCANSGGTVSLSNSALTSYYEEYKYASLEMEWIPSVGPASTDAGARCYMVFDDNPEHIANFVATPSAVGASVQAARGMKVWNAWERVKFSIPLTSRHKVFNVNSTTTYSVDVIDRSVQGIVAIYVESPSASVTVGRPRFTYKIRLTGLSNVTT